MKFCRVVDLDIRNRRFRKELSLYSSETQESIEVVSMINLLIAEVLFLIITIFIGYICLQTKMGNHNCKDNVIIVSQLWKNKKK